ncbi:hypothetical protein MHM84_20375 [Halomonas sp. McH1-25]|uniref:hypothetical protein n=1 Tax=unclassified Halomonas TaxID=2609666 RepID=UPI001EF4C162|nr:MULTISPECIES: hypothetical protein [unclassified Halomonas]MCG7602100.1 hypothetical protein [Halomonas sp. McH1-25]MCP1343018.1 hypothetical protein [Halomonas sp. FL8]MCP1362440.1 hypothetical protein [Halomonas sp. BBD45]MCP1364098.1 hypothetical protein [Halomonas sp. BBD48]
MSDHNIDDFESALKDQLEAFKDKQVYEREIATKYISKPAGSRSVTKPPVAKPVKRKPTKSSVGQTQKGLRVKLAVRKKQISLDEEFIHESRSISRLDAQLEAERAARAAGYPIVGYVIDIESM